MGWRSRNRLAADWFAKLRQNATTLEVEHTDLTEIDVSEQVETKADKTYVDNALSNIDMSTKADITYVDNALANIDGGKVLGSKHLKYKGRYRTSGRIVPLTLSYVKKSSTSRLVVQSFLWGESNSHNATLRLWNSVDGYFSDGSHGEKDCSVKLDIGEYYGSDTNSTPGSASHIAVTSTMAAGTNVEFRWYVTSNTTQIGGSWSGSYEHASCWMLITEIENG